MSGRGRGISNAPAWMTRGGDEPPPPGLPPAMGGGGPPHQHHDAFGRLSRSPPMGGRRVGRYDDRPPYDYRRGNGGGLRGDGPWDGGRGRGGPNRGEGQGGGRRRDNHRLHRDSPSVGSNSGGGGGGPPNSATASSSGLHGAITFRSFEEEMDWVEDRRRKRKTRPSKFDQEPTENQLAIDAGIMALSNPAATDFAGIPAGRDFSVVPQQTRHARRLYVGNLPPNVTEGELHTFFRGAIEQALVHKPTDNEDPILSVYINHERRFCFLEFRTVEMATACLALDGINIEGKGNVKVKRPNDYNPTMAPKVHPSAIPELDVSKLGIISGTVQDGPNKVFIGGLHYHLAEEQILELLQAFGKVKAFHLVKNEPDSLTSKGYCFVEYADPSVTPVAVMGLNGMDLGGGKVLTARVAGERAGATALGGVLPTTASTVGATMTQPSVPDDNNTGPKPGAIIVGGYDIEVLVDAALGLRPMPTAPMHLDQFGLPITMAAPMPVALPVLPQVPVSVPTAGNGLAVSHPGPSALDIANAALDAAFGGGGSVAALSQQRTRILVLLNMVTDEDLQTDEDYNGLKEEVEEEVAKYGTLVSIQIPRRAIGSIEPSAVRKIFLEYATVQDAANAEKELSGRQFGPNVVKASFFDEQEYAAGKLK
ncbi:RNA recognition motif containing protein [Nitzschia inconspicua]|uniref:RNA recognition motif containing protein n=1 Tax=Nitzschia inconspicua TaxID=303405 RepID=A0A9K3PW18_9STRA|nr:RNA recognition motif containing protein [Nitzschia inconspicua]